MMSALLLELKMHAAQWMPFMLAAGNSRAGTVNIQKIIEGLLIVFFTAISSGFVSFKVMEYKMDTLEATLTTQQRMITANANNLTLHIQREYEHELAKREAEIKELKRGGR